MSAPPPDDLTAFREKLRARLWQARAAGQTAVAALLEHLLVLAEARAAPP